MKFRESLTNIKKFLFNKTYEFDESWNEERKYPFFGKIDEYHRQGILFGSAIAIYGMVSSLVGGMQEDLTLSKLHLGMIPILVGCSDIYLRMLKEHRLKIKHPSGIVGSVSSLVETVKNALTADEKARSRPNIKSKIRLDILYGFDKDKDGEIDEIKEIFGPSYNKDHEKLLELKQYFE